MIGVFAGIGLLVLGCVLLGLAREADPYANPGSSGGEGLFWVLRVVAGVSCVGAVGLLARSIRAAAARPQPDSYYLYEGGIIHFAGGSPQVLAWPDVREARPLIAQEGAAAGQVTHYSLVRQQGMPLPVPVNVQYGPDPFVEQLLALLRSRGVNVAG